MVVLGLRLTLSPGRCGSLYGMGQTDQLVDHLDLDHRGHQREIWNQHSPPATTLFPSLLSLRGYGLLVDNPHRATWDLGCTNPQTFAYQARGEDCNTTSLWPRPPTTAPRPTRTDGISSFAAPLGVWLAAISVWLSLS